MVVVDGGKNRIGSKCMLESEEGLVVFRSPEEGNIFLSEVMEWMGNMGVVHDKWFVEVAEAKEGVDFGD